jgi:zinc protease
VSFPKSLPPLLPERPIPAPDVVAATLPNGLAVQAVRREGPPLVAVRLVVRGGSSDDAVTEPGLAQLLADSLKEGTASRGGADLAALVQESGGDLGVAAGADALVLGASGLAAKASLLLDVVADVARRASFPTGGVDRAKAIALERLETAESEPSFLGARAFAKAVYGRHPYGVTAPAASSIRAVTPARLLEESRRRLRPERSLLLVVGDVDPAAATAAAADLLGDWRGSEAPPAPVPDAEPPAGGRTVDVVDRPGSVQTLLLVGGLAPHRTSSEAYALELAVAIYGGTFSSRLVQNLREEKGYTYSPGASARWLAARGTVRTRAAVRNEVTSASLDEILREMARMGTTNPSDEEMDRARRALAGARAISLQTGAGLADELARLWVLGLPSSEIGRTAEALSKVTAADVRRVSGRFLDPALSRVVAVGEASVVRGELRALAAGN